MWTFSRLPDDSSAATFVHRCFQHEIRLRERIVICAALPFVPLVIAVLATVFTALNGQAIKQRTGKGITRQAREQIGLALRCAILPPWYYIFELHEDDKRQHTSEYVNRFEMKSGLYRLLRDYNGGLPVPSLPLPGGRTRFGSGFAIPYVPAFWNNQGDKVEYILLKHHSWNIIGTARN